MTAQTSPVSLLVTMSESFPLICVLVFLALSPSPFPTPSPASVKGRSTVAADLPPSHSTLIIAHRLVAAIVVLTPMHSGIAQTSPVSHLATMSGLYLLTSVTAFLV